MPELPEVETIVRELRASALVGQTITKAIVFWPGIVSNLSAAQFCKEIVGQTVANIERRGKFLVFSLSTDTLLVHLRMTGKFSIVNISQKRLTHEHIRLSFSDQRELLYEDQRKFGKWYLTKNPNEQLDKLGLEPLSPEFTLKAFRACLAKQSGMIKPFLLDQKHIAGMGNIYVDEALWEAKIHPQRHLNTFSKKEIEKLHQAISKILQLGVENTGTTLGSSRANYFSVSGRRGTNQHQLKVFRQEGKPCPRCQSIIVKIKVAQRGTHFCPHCQKIASQSKKFP